MTECPNIPFIVDAGGFNQENDLMSAPTTTRREFLQNGLTASAAVSLATVLPGYVLARKTGLPVPLTKLQELEWHFHAALFSLWMGYGYTINAHPRVDSFTEMLPLRSKAWLELAGGLLFAFPYMALVAYYSLDFVAQSYRLGEQSDSTVGLTHRWIIKGIYAAGLWMVVLGILSVLLRVIVFLFGKKSEREVNLQIGHVITDV